MSNEFDFTKPIPTFDLGTASTKQLEVEQASKAKKAELEWFKVPLIKQKSITDGDGISGNRLANPTLKGTSLDAYETDHGDSEWDISNNPKKEFNQKFAYSLKTGIPFKDVTEKQIEAEGELAKAYLENLAMEGQRPEDMPLQWDKDQGIPMPDAPEQKPFLERASMGKTRDGKRDLNIYRNPVTGVNLNDAMTRSDFNANLHSKYNAGLDAEKNMQDALARAEAGRDDNSFWSRQGANDHEVLAGVGGAVATAGSIFDSVLSTPEFLAKGVDAVQTGIRDLADEHIPITSKALQDTYEAASNTLFGKALSSINEANKDTGRLQSKVADELGGAVKEFTSKFEHKGKSQQLQFDLGQDWDANEGVLDVGSAMIKTAVSNPVVAAQQFAKSYPEMVLLAKKGVTGAASFISIVNGRNEEAVAEFTKRHERPPTSKELLQITGTSIASVGIDKVTSSFILSPVGKVAGSDVKAFTGALSESVIKQGNDLLSKAAAKTVAKIPGAKAVTAIAKSKPGQIIGRSPTAAAAEYVQEGSQTELEELGATLDPKALLKEEARKKAAIAGTMGFASAGIGGPAAQLSAKPAKVAAAGAVLGGATAVALAPKAGKAALDAAKKAPGAIMDAPGNIKEAVTDANAASKARKSDDPASISDPVMAFEGLKGSKHSIKADDTPEVKADKLSVLEAKNEDIYVNLINKSDEADSLTGDAEIAANKELAKMHKTYQDNSKYIKDAEQGVLPTPEEVETNIDTVLNSAPTDPNTQKDLVLNSVETNPDSISDKQLDSLINKTDGVLTSDDITYLKAHRDTRRALKSMGAVNDAVVNGTDDYIGLKDHIKAVAKSVKRGKKKATQNHLDQFGNFTQGHIEKALAAKELAYIGLNATEEEVHQANIEATLAIPENKTKGITADNIEAKIKEGEVKLYDVSNRGKFKNFTNTLISEAEALETGYNEAFILANNKGNKTYTTNVTSVMPKADRLYTQTAEHSLGSTEGIKTKLDELIKTENDLQDWKELKGTDLSDDQKNYLKNIPDSIAKHVKAFLASGGKFTDAEKKAESRYEVNEEEDFTYKGKVEKDLLKEMDQSFENQTLDTQQDEVGFQPIKDNLQKLLDSKNVTGKEGTFGVQTAKSFIEGKDNTYTDKNGKTKPVTRANLKKIVKYLNGLPSKDQPALDKNRVQDKDTLLQAVVNLDGIAYGTTKGEVELAPNISRLHRSKKSGEGKTLDNLQSLLKQKGYDINGVEDLVTKLNESINGKDHYQKNYYETVVLPREYTENNYSEADKNEGIDTSIPSVQDDIFNEDENSIEEKAAPTLASEVMENRTPYRPDDAEFFAVKPVEKGSKPNLLQTVKDFFDNITEATADLKLTDEQRDSIAGLVKFDKVFRDTLLNKVMVHPTPKIFKNKKGEEVDLLAQNPVYRLFANNPKLEDKLPKNFQSTMAMVAYEFLATRSEGAVNNTDEQVNKILNYSNAKRQPTYQEQALVADKGIVKAEVLRSIGPAILSKLGLTITGDAPDGFQEMLENDLGTLALATLEKMGAVTETSITGKEREAATGIKSTSPDSTTAFIRPKVEESEIKGMPGEVNAVLHKDIVRLKDNLAGNTILKELFQAEGQYEGPRTEEPKPEDTVTQIKRSNKLIPKVVQEILTKFNQTKWGVKLATHNVFEFIGREDIESILGVNKTLEGVQKNNLFTVKGQNQTLLKELDDYERYIKALEKGNIGDVIYFLNEQWRNTRVGQIASDGVSIQASKIHRFLIGINSHQLKIDPNNSNYNEVIEEFKTAIVEGFGFGADSLGLGSANTEFNDLMAGKSDKHKAILKAVEAVKILNKDLNTDLSPAELRADLVEGVKAGGEKIHSLDAIVALAEYQENKAFNTNIVREIDGITNGVMIGIAQMAAAEDWQGVLDLLEPTGLFSDGDINTVDKWRKNPENLDTYQSTATIMARAVSYIKDTMNNPLVYNDSDRSIENKYKRAIKAFRAVYGENVTDAKINSVMISLDHFLGPMRDKNGGILGSLRTLVKYPVMTNVFGQGIGNIINQVGLITLKENFYNKLEKSKGDDAKIQIEKKAMENIVGPINLTVKNHLSFQLTPKQIEMYSETFASYNGTGLKEAIQGRFGTFMERRGDLNNALTVIHSLFMTRYNTAIRQLQTASDKPITNKQRKAVAKKLEPFMASFEHYFSNGNVNTELQVTKQSTEKDYKDKSKVTQSRLKNEKDPTRPTTKTARAANNTWEPPGVGGLISAIHSLDSATILKTIAEFEVGNVFDAILVGLDQVSSASDQMNKSIYETMTEYSVMEKVNKSLIRSIESAKQDDKKNGNTNLIDSINTQLSTHDDTSVDYLGFNFTETDWIDDNPIPKAKYRDIEAFLSNTQYVTDTVNKIRSEVFPKIQQWIQYNNGRTGYKPKQKEVKYTEADLKNDIAKVQKPDSLGSSPTQLDSASFNPSRSELLTKATSERIFNGLKTLGTKHDTQEHSDLLAGVLNDLVNEVLTPLTFQLKKSGVFTHGSIQGNDLLLNVGHMPTLLDGTAMSAQETLLHELVHAVTRYGINDPKNYKLRAKLNKIFNVAKKKLKPKDFLNKDSNGNVILSPGKTLQMEKDAAQKRYDYIFNNLEGNGLHEFIAMGKTNAKFIELLDGLDSKRDSIPGNSLLSKFLNYVAQIFDSVSRSINGINDLSAHEELSDLAKQLAGIQTRKVTTLDRASSKLNAAEKRAIKEANKWVKDPLVKYLSQDKFVKSKNNIVAFGGTIAGVVKDDAVKEFWTASSDVFYRMGIYENTFYSSLAKVAQNVSTEVAGQTKTNKLFHVLARKSNYMIDQQRKELIELFTHAVNENILTDMTDNDKEAAGKVLLKADMGAIFNDYSDSQIRRLLTDEGYLKAETAKLEAKLDQYKTLTKNGKKFDIAKYYKKQANSLGHKMVFGNSIEDHTMDNAYSIARMFGSSMANKATWDVDEAAEIIDKLATLRALDYTDQNFKDLVADFSQREYEANPDSNGFGFIVKGHQKLMEDALDKNFDGQKALMNKGYTKEIFNPNISFKVAPLDNEEALLSEGYVRLPEKLSKDEMDQNQVPLYMFVSKDGLVNTWMKTIVSLKSEVAKGADLIKVRSQAGDGTPVLNAYKDGNALYKAKMKAVDNQFSSLVTANKTTLAEPVIDSKGNITGYRYVMSDQHKTEILEKTDAVDQLIGNMHGSIKDKVNTKVINKEAVNLLYKQYKEEFEEKPSSFVEVGANASDKDMRELYTMLPTEMRKNIKDVWGGKTVYVKKSMLNLVFGYRKLSVTQINALNKPWLKKIENIWQEGVKSTKDIIVIKSGIVLADNIISNTIQLFYEGLSLRSIKDHQLEGYDAVIRYQNTLHELIPLEQELSIGHNVKDLRVKKAKIARLKDELKFNPIKPLIDAGVFSTIVEDVEIEEGQYSYRNKAEQNIKDFINPLTKNLPDASNSAVSKTIDTAFIRHNTVMYKFLKDTTQYSDFVARYALYKHLTQTKGMSPKKAINYIAEEFVNYDLPADPYIQYANDMGLLWFTKYFMRTQKVIARTAMKYPLKVLGLAGAQSLLGTDLPSIMDSAVTPTGVLNHIQNPATVAIDSGGIHILDLIDNMS